MKFYKPKFWDIKKFTIWPYLLLPLSTIVILANFVKFRLFKKERFHIPVITVGNIYVGGTGKTPLCIEIYKILKMLKTLRLTGSKNPSMFFLYQFKNSANCRRQKKHI